MNRNTSIIRTKLVKAAFLLPLLAGLSCSTKNTDGIFSTASISPDDHLICYANSQGENKSLYVVDRTGVKVREITIPKDQVPFNPVFSPDGKKILYLSEPQNTESPESAIYLVDVDGTNSKCLTPEKENITEAIFSPDGNNVYFLSAGSYGHYSPIAQSHPHDFDIYSVDITGNNSKQLTTLKAYMMSDLTVSKDGNNLFFVQVGDQNTLFTMPVTGKAEPVSLASGFWDASVSPDIKEIAFTQMKQGNGGYTYDLYLEKLNSQNLSYSDQKQLTFLNSMVFGIRFFNQRPYILFEQQKNWPNTSSPQNILREVNLDGSDLKQIILPK